MLRGRGMKMEILCAQIRRVKQRVREEERESERHTVVGPSLVAANKLHSMTLNQDGGQKLQCLKRLARCVGVVVGALSSDERFQEIPMCGQPCANL